MAIDVAVLAQQGWGLVLAYAPKVLLALITLFVGLWLIKRLKNLLIVVMRRRDVDPTLRPFLGNITVISLKVLLLISVVGMLGVQVTSFIALLGAAGLAVGLALQGSLANFAGGVLILLFKPFRVGDFITAQGESGTVHEISILHTILKTPDNKTIILPNGPVANGNVVNFSVEPTRKLEWTFGIGYDDDIKVAKKIVEDILKKDERTLQDKDIQIVLGALADSSVNIIARVWVKKEEYWGMFFDVQEAVKIAFDKKGITIPYPQREMHVYNYDAGKKKK